MRIQRWKLPSTPRAAAAAAADDAATATAAAAAIELLRSELIDILVAFSTTWDGGMKKRWIVYNIHAMTAEDLELLAQELAAKLNVDRVVVLRALLATVSLRKAGWQEPLASSLSGTHVGIFECARGAGAAGRARTQMQNDLAAFLNEQRNEFTLDKDRAHARPPVSHGDPMCNEISQSFEDQRQMVLATAAPPAAGVERRLSPQERARTQMQNDLAAFLKEQRNEFTLDKDRAQLWRALPPP